MTHTEIVKKLIGNIQPAGDASVDDERYENLKSMCELVNNLVSEIDRVQYENRYAHQGSIKRSVEYAGDFLTNKLGINNE